MAEIITRAHDHSSSAHEEIDKTLGRLWLWFYWPKKVSQVMDYKASEAPNEMLGL